MDTSHAATSLSSVQSGATRETFSVIVATKDRPRDLEECVTSIFAQRRLPMRLIVVDASDSGTQERNQTMLERFSGTTADIVYIKSERASLTYQRNQGVQCATADIVFLLDDDVVLLPEFFDEMMATYAQSGDTMYGLQGVDPSFQPPTRLNQLANLVFLPGSTWSAYQQGMHRSGFSFFKSNSTARIQPVEWMAGYCMSFRREVFEHHRFDTLLDGYALSEDKDFSYRVSRQYPIYRLMNAKLVHHLSSVNRLDQTQLMKMWVINRHMLFRRNFYDGYLSLILHLWALGGNVLVTAFHGARRRNLDALRGMLIGMRYLALLSFAKMRAID